MCSEEKRNEHHLKQDKINVCELEGVRWKDERTKSKCLKMKLSFTEF